MPLSVSRDGSCPVRCVAAALCFLQQAQGTQVRADTASFSVLVLSNAGWFREGVRQGKGYVGLGTAQWLV